MLQTLATGPYLGLDDPDMGKLYLFVGVVVVVLIALAILRGMGRIKEIRHERASAWKTFRKLAKARGLLPPEEQVLAKATRLSRIKRPFQVLAAIQVFDKVVNDFLDSQDVNESEQAHLVIARQKLVSSVEPRSKGQERRQLERATTSLPINVQVVAREWVEEETKGAEGEEDPKFRETFDGLLEGVVSLNAKMIDISAGGLCLTTSDEAEVQEDDYVKLSGNVEILPIDINGLIGKITGFREPENEDAEWVIHVRFLNYDHDLRRQIIKLVYEKQQPKKPTRKKSPQPTKSATPPPKPAAEESGES